MLVKVCLCELDICDRRPFVTNTDALPPDDRFAIEIESITDLYIPHRQYNGNNLFFDIVFKVNSEILYV